MSELDRLKQLIEGDPSVRLECQIETGIKNARRNWKRYKKIGTPQVTDEDFKRVVSTKWIRVDRTLAILDEAFAADKKLYVIISCNRLEERVNAVVEAYRKYYNDLPLPSSPLHPLWTAIRNLEELKISKGHYLCEFARDCLTEDGEHCETNPDDCPTYTKKAKSEEEK